MVLGTRSVLRLAYGLSQDGFVVFGAWTDPPRSNSTRRSALECGSAEGLGSGFVGMTHGIISVCIRRAGSGNSKHSARDTQARRCMPCPRLRDIWPTWSMVQCRGPWKPFNKVGGSRGPTKAVVWSRTERNPAEIDWTNTNGELRPPPTDPERAFQNPVCGARICAVAH